MSTSVCIFIMLYLCIFTGEKFNKINRTVETTWAMVNVHDFYQLILNLTVCGNPSKKSIGIIHV